MKQQKTPDEQIKEFCGRKNTSWVEGYKQRHPEIDKPKKAFKWYQIPVYFALIVDLSCLFFLPPLIVICLLRYLGVI